VQNVGPTYKYTH